MTDGDKIPVADTGCVAIEIAVFQTDYRALRYRQNRKVIVHCTKRRHIDVDTAMSVYRILQESLTNVARHAQAKTLRVTLRFVPKRVELKVIDDGVGLDPNA